MLSKMVGLIKGQAGDGKDFKPLSNRIRFTLGKDGSENYFPASSSVTALSQMEGIQQRMKIAGDNNSYHFKPPGTCHYAKYFTSMFTSDPHKNRGRWILLFPFYR